MWQETRAKYTDAEVDAIVAVHSAIVDAHHAKYTDAEVDAIVATHAAINDAHHAKYTDAEAVNAVETEGKIGINNTSPSSMLDVVGIGVTKDTPVIPDNEDTISIYGDGRAYFKGRDVTNDIEFLVGTSTAGYAFAGAMSNHDFRLRTNNADRLTVEAGTGWVGVGTTAPTAKLDVNSNIIRLRTAKTPATAAAAGNQGDWCWDASYFYICVAANTWERTPHAWDTNVYDDAAVTKLAGIETEANVGSKFMWAWVNWDDGNSSHQTLGSLPANAFVVRTFLHITTQFDDTVCVVSVGTTGDPDAYMQNYTLTAIAAGVKDDVVWGVNRGYRSGADGTVQTTLLTMGGDGTQGAALIGLEYMVVGANS